MPATEFVYWCLCSGMRRENIA